METSNNDKSLSQKNLYIAFPGCSLPDLMKTLNPKLMNPEGPSRLVAKPDISSNKIELQTTSDRLGFRI